MNHQAEFLKLIKENERIIFKVCRMYMDTVVDRQDLFQEIVGQAWRSYESFKGLSKFSSWLYRIALNTALTYFKKNKRSKNTI
jgi:RNA polymerase sigma-70 factor (ECF subfamily)